MSEEKLEEYHNDKRVATFKKVDRRLGYRPKPKPRYTPLEGEEKPYSLGTETQLNALLNMRNPK